MLCFYRISDESQGNVCKPKLSGATKMACLQNFVKTFNTDNLFVVADCVSDVTYKGILDAVGGQQHRIIRTNFKSGAFSFLFAVKTAVNSRVPNDAPVYLVEDDYIHKPNAQDIILEGLRIADYVTGYDHPDKYDPRAYPNGELSTVLLTKSSHWKTTQSTTMTFATTVGVLKDDLATYEKYCNTGYPYDHDMFLELGSKKRRIISSIPGVCTHAEIYNLAPLHNWESSL